MATKINWDTKASTYYWTIELDQNNPANTIPKISGYSKVEGQNEATDKANMLKRKILNLYTNGYFKRCVRIDIYQNTGVYIDKKLDPCILNLYPTSYNIPTQNHDVIYKIFAPFLNEFYQRINANKSLDNILPVYRKIKSQDQFLDIHAYNFKNIGQLYSHAARLSINGHPEGAVSNFIKMYKDKQKWI